MSLCGGWPGLAGRVSVFCARWILFIKIIYYAAKANVSCKINKTLTGLLDYSVWHIRALCVFSGCASCTCSSAFLEGDGFLPSPVLPSFPSRRRKNGGHKQFQTDVGEGTSHSRYQIFSCGEIDTQTGFTNGDWFPPSPATVIFENSDILPRLTPYLFGAIASYMTKMKYELNELINTYLTIQENVDVFALLPPLRN